jgi:PD-(D/E)XK nuclease superfamily
VGRPMVARMDAAPASLTAVQARTMVSLITPGGGRAFDLGLADRLRDRVEDAAAGLDPGDPVRLTKATLNQLARCEGSFAAALDGEREPFAHSPKTAAGTLQHKAIELEAGSREPLDPFDLAQRAAERLEDDRRFAEYWRDLDRLGQDEVLTETVRRIDLFRASFPPLRDHVRLLAPVPELPVGAQFAGGALTVWGRVDLALCRSEPGLATRVLIDLKGGRAWPDYPEDMRLYALLYTLRYGVPPLRVATVFLESGEWQPEDVTEETLGRAVDRLASAAAAAAAVRAGRPPELRPGRHCEWCPRGLTCPASAVGGGA